MSSEPDQYFLSASDLCKIIRIHAIYRIRDNIIKLNKLLLPDVNLGLDDAFPEHGSRNEILKLNGLDTDSIKEQISNF